LTVNRTKEASVSEGDHYLDNQETWQGMWKWYSWQDLGERGLEGERTAGALQWISEDGGGRDLCGGTADVRSGQIMDGSVGFADEEGKDPS
jgi:hypothetical protein